MVGVLCGCLSIRPLTSRHRCDMPVRWSYLSTADFHLVRLSSTTSFCERLFRSLNVSSALSVSFNGERFGLLIGLSWLAGSVNCGWSE